MLIVLSRNFAVTYALFGYLLAILPHFQYFWVNFGPFWTDFEHFLKAFISRFSVNVSVYQMPSRLRIICRFEELAGNKVKQAAAEHCQAQQILS